MNYRHGSKRICGVVVPVSAIRTSTSPGCGEYPDLAAFGELAHRWRLDLIQLLPIQDTGVQTSPYSALSAFALHPLYLRLQDLPELMPDTASERGIVRSARIGFLKRAEELYARFSASEIVPHEALLDAKLSILGEIWKSGAFAACGAELDAFIEAKPWVRKYAAFIELKRRCGGLPWWKWSEYRDPLRADIDALWSDPDFYDDLRRHAWIQMRADSQLLSAARSLANSGVELMGDIPILMNEDSAEVWADRSLFMMGSIAGAPPDMYSSLGQNWGFPIYNWPYQASDGYSFWKSRLRAAEAYYSAFRIDHVLGFFRIWALSEKDSTGYLGHFVPELAVSRIELDALGFSVERLRWLSKPHIRAAWLRMRLSSEEVERVMSLALDRIGKEELFLFKQEIRGEKDIEALNLDSGSKEVLGHAWRDRALYEFDPGSYVLAWRPDESTAWTSLSEEERSKLGRLFSLRRIESEKIWAREGGTILRELVDSVPMLACAEDLGSVPACVPATLEKLGILGLRVLRWTRAWDEPGSPLIPPAQYPALTVACPSVHDSSCLREWWEKEAEKDATWSSIAAWLGRDIGPCPDSLDPCSTGVILEAMAKSASQIVVYPVQDLMALSEKRRDPDFSRERINIPGTTGGRNWAYRMFPSVEELTDDSNLASMIVGISKARF